MGVRDLRHCCGCSTTVDEEIPDLSEVTGLAEALLGLDGFTVPDIASASAPTPNSGTAHTARTPAL